AHRRAAQSHALAVAVRAGLGRGDGRAAPAIEGLFEEERGDPELVGPERAEDLVDADRREVTLDRRVLASHDEVRAAVVLPDQRVEEGLARARVAHRARED